MDAKQERSSRSKVNAALAALGREYHDGLALSKVDDILNTNGFNGMEPGVYCGRDGHVNEQVGERTWLSFSWHKMEVTGRYEIVAYVS